MTELEKSKYFWRKVETMTERKWVKMNKNIHSLFWQHKKEQYTIYYPQKKKNQNQIQISNSDLKSWNYLALLLSLSSIKDLPPRYPGQVLILELEKLILQHYLDLVKKMVSATNQQF